MDQGGRVRVCVCVGSEGVARRLEKQALPPALTLRNIEALGVLHCSLVRAAVSLPDMPILVDSARGIHTRERSSRTRAPRIRRGVSARLCRAQFHRAPLRVVVEDSETHSGPRCPLEDDNATPCEVCMRHRLQHPIAAGVFAYET